MEGERELAGLRCGQVLERLQAYIDGELTAEERAQVDGHLAACDVCERFGGAYAELVRVLRVSEDQ